MSLGTTEVSPPNGISFRPTALVNPLTKKEIKFEFDAIQKLINNRALAKFGENR